MHLEPPGGKACEVEDLVHQRLQVPRRRLDPLHRPDHPRPKLAVRAILQQVDEPDDRRQGRAQFVRDVGEELRFRPVRARELEGEVFQLRAAILQSPALCALVEQERGESQRDHDRDHPDEHHGLIDQSDNGR